MPHSDHPKPAPADPPAAPAVRAGPKCPSCGRSPAVIFRAIRPGVPRRQAPLVCRDCCPKPPGRA